MVQILISWFLIALIYYTSGDFLISLFYKEDDKTQKYNVIDIFLLGLTFTTVVLTLLSLFLPINHYILLALLTLSLLYWTVKFSSLKSIAHSYYNKLKELSLFNIIILALLFISIAIMCLWGTLTFDPAFYHYQNITWIEEYPAVPGLANLEDRFGFNSNIFIHYSLFSLRFIFGQPVYIVQAFFAVAILCQIAYTLIRSGYNIKMFILLVVYLAFIFSIPVAIVDSWTDILPNLLIFYMVYQIILYPDSFYKKSLLFFIIPVLLVTFKLSVAPFCLIGLFIFIYLIKAKDYRKILPLLIISLAVCIPWLIRNVIISGYLIYPIYELDIFSFDWKVPLDVAIQQRQYMTHYANGFYTDLIIITVRNFLTTLTFSDQNKFVYIESFIIILSFISLLLAGFLILFKKNLHPQKKIYVLLYITLFICIGFWFISARDYRFAYGILSSMSFLAFYLFIPFNKKIMVGKLGLITITTFLLIFCCQWGIVHYLDYLRIYKYDRNPLTILLISPYSVEDKKKVALLDAYLINTSAFDKKELKKNVDNLPHIESRYYRPYHLNNGLSLFLSTLREGCSYNYFPCVADKQNSKTGKFEDIRNVEARGYSLSDGFRVKQKKELR